MSNAFCIIRLAIDALKDHAAKTKRGDVWSVSSQVALFHGKFSLAFPSPAILFYKIGWMSPVSDNQIANIEASRGKIEL